MRWLLTILLACGVASWSHADVIVDVIPFTARTTAGSQDLTGAFGGAQPKGALALLSRGVASGTIAPHAHTSIGFYDGTTQFFLASQAEDAQATTDTDNAAEKTAIAALQNIDRTIMCAMVASWITNGIRLTQSAGCDQAYMGTVVLFGGTDTRFTVGFFNGAGVIGGSTQISLPYEPEIIFLGKTRLAAFTAGGQATYSTNLMISQNVVGPGGDPKYGLTHVSQNGQTSGLTATRVQSNALYTLDVKDPDGSFRNTAHSPTGFTVINETVANAEEIGFATINFGGTVPVRVDNLMTPSTTGTFTYTAAGFRPQFTWMWTHGLTTFDTTHEAVTTDNDPGATGMAVYDGTDTFSLSSSTQDAASSPAMKSVASTTDVRLLSNPGTLAWQATLSHIDLGQQWVFTQTAGPRPWFRLLIGSAAVPQTTRRRIPGIFMQ